jgi:hypothetical protein
MKELITFFKEIFMITDENSKKKVGLSQFKKELTMQETVKKVAPMPKELKLSDLMRRSA